MKLSGDHSALLLSDFAGGEGILQRASVNINASQLACFTKILVPPACMFFIFPEYIFHLKNQSFFQMFLSLQSIFFIIPKYVFYASYSMFFFSCGACFFTYLLHVIFQHICYLSLACYLLLYCMFYQSYVLIILVISTNLVYFFCSQIPSPPVFPYRSSQCNHCFLHGCPSFALPLNPSLKRIYTAPLSTCFLPSVLLVA